MNNFIDAFKLLPFLRVWAIDHVAVRQQII